ncbi:MAG: phage portal protein [Cycloclasticus sp.]
MTELIEQPEQDTKAKPVMFDFGEPESVIGNALDELGSYEDDSQGYYEPPIEKEGIAKLLLANGTHESMANLKTNMIARFYKPNKFISFETFFKMAMDWNVFGEYYVQNVFNRFGKLIECRHLPAVPMRVATNKNRFVKVLPNGKLIKFKQGEVSHCKRYNIHNSQYGSPEYLGAFQSILLGEDSILFKRRYYKNGAHMGFILFSQDPDLSPEVEEDLRQKLKQSKGVGNFNSMFVNIPNSTAKEPLKLIPVGEVGSSDDLETAQRVSKENVLGAWRIPEALSSSRSGNGNTGDIIKAVKAYTELEIIPMFPHLQQINLFLPEAARIEFNIPKTSIFEE